VLEDDRRALAVRQLEHALDEVGGVVVEHLVGHALTEHLALLLGARARDHARAGELRDLDRGAAEPARASPHEHGVGRVDTRLADEHLPGGDVRVREGGDVLVRHGRVERHREARRHEEELGVRAVVDVEVGTELELPAHAVPARAALHVRVGGDAVSRPKALDLRADLDDVAADVDAKHGRQVDVVLRMRVSPADPDVPVVDGRRAEADEQIPGPRSRLGDLVELEHLRPAVRVDADCPHLRGARRRARSRSEARAAPVRSLRR
jgi:hypothetical protein